MKAAVMYAAGDVRVENVPDPELVEPTDALVRVTKACICGSDLWPYQSMPRADAGRRMGHEFIGIVEDAGRDVRTVRKGDLVVAPFAGSDGTCEFCRQGLQTSCLHGGFWGGELDGGQGEAVRVPLADGTLVKPDHELMPGLLRRRHQGHDRLRVDGVGGAAAQPSRSLPTAARSLSWAAERAGPSPGGLVRRRASPISVAPARRTSERRSLRRP